jgi:hypothetical protein
MQIIPVIDIVLYVLGIVALLLVLGYVAYGEEEEE